LRRSQVALTSLLLVATARRQTTGCVRLERRKTLLRLIDQLQRLASERANIRTASAISVHESRIDVVQLVECQEAQKARYACNIGTQPVIPAVYGVNVPL
jgi:hypothetical protein